MAIASLRLNGFKSFGRQCGFEFSKNFTAIVGPNGSGKSNILDALKWILGEGSASGLRITRQSDLLFQGSSSTAQAKNAEVVLKLENEDDNGTLRRIYAQDTGALLFFDGRKILLQDLDKIKTRFNLEGEGFALIGQGEISDTIHQRPKERRKQFDALFGIERYRERRDDSIKKLEDTQNEALRIKTLIDELNIRRGEISDDVKIAVEAQGIIDELDALRHDYYFFKRLSIEHEQGDLDLKRHIITSRIDDFSRWLKFWSRALNFYEGKLASDTSGNLFLSRLENINAQKNSIQQRAYQLASQVKDIRTRRGELNGELDTLMIQKQALEQERERTNNEHENLARELDEKSKDFSERERIFKDAQSKSQNELARRKKILDDTAALKLRCSRIEADITAIEKSRETNSQEIKEFQDERAEIQNMVEKLISQKNLSEEKFTRLSFLCQQKNSEVQSFRRELAHFESQYANLSNIDFFSAGIYPEPVRIILMASEKNLIISKPKAVADVFSCSSSKIAEAIEAYLGGRQFWLLVHTLEEAQEGIDFLKSNKAGRATYLALERCKTRDIDTKINTNASGITGWAMDLIKFDEKWEKAVSHIMGDLLIVQDYGTAGALVRAGAKFPIATLEGEVFAPSGSVSGGSSKQKSGAVTAKQKLDEINIQLENLRKSIAISKGNLDNAVNAENTARKEFEDASNELDGLKSTLNAAQRNLKSVTASLERLIDEHEKSEGRTKKLKEEKEKASIKLAELEKEFETLPEIHEENYELVITPLKNELRLLQERLNVTKTLYDRVDSEYKSVCSRIDKAQKEISSGKKIEENNLGELKILGRDKLKAYQEEKKLREEISKRDDEFASARKKASRIRIKIDKANANISGVNNELSAIDGKISHTESELNQLIELWEEKYPYNQREAREIEGGRELTSTLRKLERELKSLGKYNLGALSEDQSLMERIDFLTEQLEDVEISSADLKNLIEDTDTQVEKSFTNSMAKVDNRFNELFQRLFGGGEARLILQSGESIWDRGVEIFARPPGKKLQNISQLSGGEQSLTSIALIFATLEAAGTPLAVLDEVDAALDEYNLIRFADLAKEYSNSIQIIAMTHRRATIERANLIYGVTMIEPGLSATVGINPENYE